MRTDFTRHDNVVTPRPNWGSGVNEVFEFKTEVFMAEDGTETRHSYRVMPRITVEYESDMMDVPARRLFEDRFALDHDHEFIVPVRWRGGRLAAEALTPATSITLTGAAPWWLQPGLSMVLESSSEQEAVVVDSVADAGGDTTVTLTTPISGSYPVGSRAMMGLWTVYQQEATYRSLIRRHRRAGASFLASPGRLPELAPTAPARPRHKGYEVIRGYHNWREAFEFSTDDRREVVDTGQGVIDYVWSRDHQDVTELRQFTGMTQEAVDDLVQTFMRHRGMRVPFWTQWAGRDVPPWNPSRGAGTKTLFFYGETFRPKFAGHPLFNYLWAQWPDGAVQVNKIVSSASQFGNDYAILEDPWERDIDETVQMSWAVLARFATDRLEVEWQTAETAEFNLPIRALTTAWVDRIIARFVQPVASVVAADTTMEWSDPLTYSSITLDQVGVTLELVDQGEADVNFAWTARVDSERPDEYRLVTQIAFFDEAGTLISQDQRGGNYGKSEGNSRTHSFDRDYSVPANTREIRARVFCDRAFEAPTVNALTISQRDWGRNFSGGNLKWG